MYPVIMTEYKDEDGRVVTVYSPNIPGMHTEGKDFNEAAYWAVDAIATMLDGKKEYPEVMDAGAWELQDNERIAYIPVNMAHWYRENMSQTVRRSVTVPKYLNVLANEEKINVSQVLSEALAQRLGF
ncbi:antitoxin HicB [Fructobacillus sp. S1-1]|uniref:Antitoxin HicB n=2 Tax=Fructobacillus parabroussonetiae TaxID=2713174 RepID=A0ABS5R1B3_9LACO|nr:antitoxin HicB [Fructobacillus parabroussonetiae]